MNETVNWVWKFSAILTDLHMTTKYLYFFIAGESHFHNLLIEQLQRHIVF